MKYKFQYFGMPSVVLKESTKHIVDSLKTKTGEEILEFVNELWDQNEREFQYLGITILKKYKQKSPKNFLQYAEFYLTNKSWWDTVDILSANIVGSFVKENKEPSMNTLRGWSNHKNMWLNRASIIFQLTYRNQTDTNFLFDVIQKHSHSTEFFHQKAIGWALREYAKTKPKEVIEFVEKVKLKPLSVREALKHIVKIQKMDL